MLKETADKKRRIKKSLLFSFLAFFLLISFLPLVSAQELEIDYPEIGGLKPKTVQTGLPEYAKYIFNFTIIISGIIILAILVWSGFLYFTSAGKPERLKNAKEQLFSAATGLVILLSSYIILATVNPNLLIFELPFSESIISPTVKPLPEIKMEEPILIAEELPLGQMIKDGLWETKRTQELNSVINNFEGFLKQEIQVNDSALHNSGFNSVSDLNKYLSTLTDECHCENLRSFCTSPETGSLPIGCSGDPCQKEQNLDVETDSPRAKINNVLGLDRQKIKTFLDYREKINTQKDLLREEIRKFQEVEGGIIACQNQNYELTTLNQYLLAKQFLEGEKSQIVKIDSKYNLAEAKANPLNFYCSVGGSVFDYPYVPEQLEVSPEDLSLTEPNQESFEIEKISCPVKLPMGEILDQLRELAIIQVLKLEKISLLISQISAEIQKMTELVSQCNDEECGASCACIPNPCYGCCSPIPCTICVPFCLSPCLQGIGGCHGDACPSEKIKEQAERIRKTEGEILETVQEIKNISLLIPDLLKKTNNLNASVDLCHSSDIYNPDWVLLSCHQAQGNYGPNGQIMLDCNPRDLYCCSLSQRTKPLLPPSTENQLTYIIPAKKFQPLVSVNNCPQGWLCSNDVKYYNQYNDASEPLKQLLSCMRKRLDGIQQQKEAGATIGIIASISDPKIYQKTCDWETGPTEPGGCSHIYEIKHGKTRVSAHYGGTACQYEHKSYAVDIDISPDIQKKYADKIVKAAKECSPGAYILDKVEYILINIGEIYHCDSNDS